MKPQVDVRCCHVANDLTNLTGDRQTNKRTTRPTGKQKDIAPASEGGI